MAYRRKKTSYKRKRSYRKRAIPRSMAPSTFMVKQKTFINTWTFSTAATTDFWRYYRTTLSEMNNFAEHCAVFDEYKISRVTFEFRPNYDNFSPDNTLWMFGTCHTIVDSSSSTTPSGAFGSATLNSFLEQGNVKSRKFGNNVSLSVKPKVASQVFGGGLNGRLVAAPWLKTTETTVEHRGAHIYLQPFDSTLVPIKYDVFYTVTVLFRGHK